MSSLPAHLPRSVLNSRQTPVSAVEATTTASVGSLSYDAATGTYNYVWKNEASWAGTSRTFTMVLDDGTTHQVMYRFVR